MKRISLILNYFSKFLLLLSLFLTTTDFMKGLKLILLIVASYTLYKLTASESKDDDIKAYNYLHVATIFVFALYAAGFAYVYFNKIVFGLLISSFIGMILSVLYEPRKSIRIESKGMKELKELIAEAETIKQADKLIKEIETEKAKSSKKTAKKKTTKKRSRKTTSAQKSKTSSNKTAKKSVKKKVVPKKKAVKSKAKKATKKKAVKSKAKKATKKKVVNKKN